MVGGTEWVRSRVPPGVVYPQLQHSNPPRMALDPSHLPYFLDPEPGGDDFHRSSAPSEDIWKKFELPLPSPPLSPPLPTLGPQDEEYLLDPGSGMGHPRLLDNLSAFILRDCMWSGFSTLERLEKMGASWGQQDPSSGLGGECVDPGAVFPGPDSKIPASSGSESQSDSGKALIFTLTPHFLPPYPGEGAWVGPLPGSHALLAKLERLHVCNALIYSS